MWKHWVNQKILRNKWKQTDVNGRKKFVTEHVITQTKLFLVRLLL